MHITRSIRALIILACLASAAPAMGHALAERSVPGAGETLSSPPAAVSIYFDAKLEPLFSKLTVTDDQGVKISRGSEVARDNPKVLTAKIAQTAKGTCHVYWDVASRDGHRSKGDYTFTVR